jgi:filamentous hemagglutinin family protein
MRAIQTDYRYFSAIGLAIALLTIAQTANAQIVPDRTLPANSTATPEGNTLRIDGGTRSRSNLFHSFEQFSVPTDVRALFNNSPEVQNIFSRVTGNTLSEIDGTLATNGTANLFLLNPNGIVFGENARLDVGGSFFATSAERIDFANGSEFSTVNPQSSSILNVSVPVGLGFGSSPGTLVNRSRVMTPDFTGNLNASGLQVQPGQNLALVGGDIQLNDGHITAFGGRLELASLTANNAIALVPDGTGWSLGEIATNNLADIDLANLSEVDATGIGGGAVRVRGRHITLSGGSKISSLTLGDLSGQPVEVEASESVRVLGTTDIPGLFEPAEAQFGILVPQRSAINTNTFGAGDAGDIEIQTRELIVRNGGQITANVFIPGTGNGGDLLVNASESVEVNGVVEVGLGGESPFGSDRFLVEINGASSLGTVTGTTGDAGNITINTNRLRVVNGAVNTANTFAQGKGGNLVVNAAESIEVGGTSPNGVVLSSMTASSVTAGEAGDVELNTQRLLVRDGGQVSAETSGFGAGGNLTITATNRVDVISNPDLNIISQITAGTDGAGSAGNLLIETGRLQLNDAGEVTVSGEETGSAGNLTVLADTVSLNRSLLNATTQAGDRGNIFLQADTLLMLRGSEVTTNASGTANGGNIEINAAVLTLLEDSQIAANAIEGRGGNINIETEGIFNSAESQISATSQLGIDGIVEVRQPDVDLQSDLATLALDFVSPDRVVADSCLDRRGRQQGYFTVSGTGGLPPTPYQDFSGSYQVMEVRSLGEIDVSSPSAGVSSPERDTWTVGDPIREANGSIQTEDGRILLETQSRQTAIAPATDFVCPSNQSESPVSSD